MSLNIKERKETINEFKENLKLCNLTVQDIAEALQITDLKVEEIINLQGSRIEDPWIIRNFILDYSKSNNIDIKPFSKLKGNYEDYYFLNTEYIRKGKISNVNFY